MSIASLPTTFRHAISAVRLLGIRYLWIDSLCIVQDSEIDWQVESSLMTNVYGHAVVNIAATSASDSSGGLFFPRDPTIVQPFAAYSPGGDGLNAGWYVWDDDGRWDRLGDQPLNQRGWVLQERLLSTRTIHFTKSEIIWQCLEDLSSESIPTQVQRKQLAMPVMQIGDYTDIRLAIARAQIFGPTVANLRKIYRSWNRLLAHYSTCRLTMDGDKLVAISGLVRYLEEVTGDECLAGLWKSQMPECLLWSVDWHPEKETPLRLPLMKTIETSKLWPKEWRAPSWSWASHNIPITSRFIGLSPIPRAEIIEASVSTTPNGMVLTSNLCLR